MSSMIYVVYMIYMSDTSDTTNMAHATFVSPKRAIESP